MSNSAPTPNNRPVIVVEMPAGIRSWSDDLVGHPYPTELDFVNAEESIHDVYGTEERERAAGRPKPIISWQAVDWHGMLGPRFQVSEPPSAMRDAVDNDELYDSASSTAGGSEELWDLASCGSSNYADDGSVRSERDALQEESNGHPEEEDCIVCSDPWVVPNSSILSCPNGHSAHTRCWFQWVRTRESENQRVNCILCRREVKMNRLHDARAVSEEFHADQVDQ